MSFRFCNHVCLRLFSSLFSLKGYEKMVQNKVMSGPSFVLPFWLEGFFRFKIDQFGPPLPSLPFDPDLEPPFLRRTVPGIPLKPHFLLPFVKRSAASRGLLVNHSLFFPQDSFSRAFFSR